MLPNLRSVLVQASRGGRDVGSRRNFGSKLGIYETKGGRGRRVSGGGGSQTSDKILSFGKYLTYGYCAVAGWAIIEMIEYRRTLDKDFAESRGLESKTTLRDVLRWFGA